MIVTTARDTTEQQQSQARRLAATLAAEYAERGKWSLAKLQDRTEDALVLVVSAEGLHLYGRAGEPLYFHPGTSVIRIKRLRGGKRENLVEACAVERGDAVLDCTAGMGTDAILLAYAAGPEGKVTALESEPVLAWIVSAGLETCVCGTKDVDEAMRRVSVVRSDHLAYMRALPDNSFDIVYFDPMFRVPIEASSSISPLRQLANHRPLGVEALNEAVRVARKTVVVKERRDSGEFERLGLRHVLRFRTKIAYGVIRL